MLGNQEYTFFIKFRVCGSPEWTTYRVVQLSTNGMSSFEVNTEDEARNLVSRLRISGDVLTPDVHAPEIPDKTMTYFKVFFKKL